MNFALKNVELALDEIGKDLGQGVSWREALDKANCGLPTADELGFDVWRKLSTHGFVFGPDQRGHFWQVNLWETRDQPGTELIVDPVPLRTARSFYEDLCSHILSQSD